MRAPIGILLLQILLCITTSAKAQHKADSTAYSLQITTVDIAAQRPLREIGVQHTILDSTALRYNIASSLADVLASNSSIFIKSYGRATLSTASFRGTAPSHTQVTWNGMKINSPMLGQVDFSLIPSYFIDQTEIYHGASSVGVTGGGLGGAIALATSPVQREGLGLRYIQGVGSFTTFDEFLHLTYKARHWSSSTRLLYSSSKNDFHYTNYRLKEFTTDAEGQITGSYYPRQRNRNGGFRDLHLLQELYREIGSSRLSLTAWYMNSHRGLPLLNTDRNTDKQKRNTQDEQTLRAVLGWELLHNAWRWSAKAGYTYTELLYLYKTDPEGEGKFVDMIRSKNVVHTGFVQGTAEYCPNAKWSLSADVSAHQNQVQSADTAPLGNTANGVIAQRGYREARFELSGFLAVKWRPIPRLGFALSLREELYGQQLSPLIPAGFIDYLLSRRGTVVLKASLARNFRYPTLNDLYFQPGGNTELRPERGYTWDVGVEFALKDKAEGPSLRGAATFFDSRIDDWILWLGTTKNVWTPINIKQVHSYGVELKLGAIIPLGTQWRLFADGNFAWTRSLNQGDPFSPADRSVGKQLPYIPQYSSAVTGRMQWKNWILSYKWCWYSERYTMSNNELGLLGRVKPYFMNDLSLEKGFSSSWADFSLKGCINNLFNEEYESVLARPMARRNYSIFIGITPKFRKGRSLSKSN